MATAVVSFQWFFWGYSLAFSHTAGKYIGDLENFGFRNVLGAPSVGSTKIPDLMFAVYQGMFAAITVALAIGAVAERGRMLPSVVSLTPTPHLYIQEQNLNEIHRSSCSSGPPSSTTQLPAGHGTLPDGSSRWEVLISPVEPQCIFPLDVPLSHTPSCWASVVVTALTS